MEGCHGDRVQANASWSGGRGAWPSDPRSVPQKCLISYRTLGIGIQLQEHNGCACVEMALSVVPLSWLFACAFLSHSSIRCFPLFQHLLFSAQRCIGDEGPYKGNSDLLRHRYLKVLEMKGILFRGFFPFLFEMGWLRGRCIRSDDSFPFLGTYCVLETYHVLSHLILMVIPKRV